MKSIGYNRNYSELTLHRVLRKLIRLLEIDIKDNVRELGKTTIEC